MAKPKPAGGLFPEWQAEQAAKAAADPMRDLPKRIRDMHRVHGAAPGKVCGACRHLLTYQQASTWNKCAKSRITGGAGTDWRKRWPACGLFEHDEQATNH